MSYLILTRRPGQRVRISARPGATDEQLLHSLRNEGIDIVLCEVSGKLVKIGFDAPRVIMILRDELSADS
ncbi:carbon storage regulator [Pseudomonas aeruginosa]